MARSCAENVIRRLAPLRAGGQTTSSLTTVERVRKALAVGRTSPSRPTRAPTTPSTTRTSRCTTRRRRPRVDGSSNGRVPRRRTCRRDDRPRGPRGPGAGASAGWTTSSPGTARPSCRRRRTADRSRGGRLDVRGQAALRHGRTTGRLILLRSRRRAPRPRLGGAARPQGRVRDRPAGGGARSSSRRSASDTSRAAPRPAARASSGSRDAGTTRPALPTRRPPGTPNGSSPAHWRRWSAAGTGRRSSRCSRTRSCATSPRCGSTPGSPCRTHVGPFSSRQSWTVVPSR